MMIEAARGRLQGLLEEHRELERGVDPANRKAVIWTEAREIRDHIAHVEMLHTAWLDGQRRILARGLANALATGHRI